MFKSKDSTKSNCLRAIYNGGLAHCFDTTLLKYCQPFQDFFMKNKKATLINQGLEEIRSRKIVELH